MTYRHSFDFDPTCGMTPEELRRVISKAEVPADFAAFWRGVHAEFTARPLDYEVRPLWSPPDLDQQYFLIDARGYAGVKIGLWLRRPAVSQGGQVIGHGYGNPGFTEYGEPELTVCMPCSRGMGRSQCAEIPWDSSYHVIHGIESKERCVLKGAAADLWLAASILLDLYPDCRDNLNYSGGSYGGGMGAIAIPWDGRFRSAYLNVPTFGNNPDRLRFVSVGSGEAVRRYHLKHPEAMAVLNYYDAATHAGYFTIPTLVVPAYFDPAVLPVGQWAVANAVPPEFARVIPAPAGHWTTPDNDPVYAEVGRTFRAMCGLE